MAVGTAVTAIAVHRNAIGSYNCVTECIDFAPGRSLGPVSAVQLNSTWNYVSEKSAHVSLTTDRRRDGVKRMREGFTGHHQPLLRGKVSFYF